MFDSIQLLNKKSRKLSLKITYATQNKNLVHADLFSAGKNPNKSQSKIKLLLKPEHKFAYYRYIMQHLIQYHVFISSETKIILFIATFKENPL